MEYKKIYDEMMLLSRITGEWCDKGFSDELERDMVLDKIKKLYAEIKFAGDAVEDKQPEIKPAIKLASTEQVSDVVEKNNIVVDNDYQSVAEPQNESVAPVIIEESGGVVSDETVTVIEEADSSVDNAIDMTYFTVNYFDLKQDGETEEEFEKEIVIDSMSITGADDDTESIDSTCIMSDNSAPTEMASAVEPDIPIPTKATVDTKEQTAAPEKKIPEEESVSKAYLNKRRLRSLYEDDSNFGVKSVERREDIAKEPVQKTEPMESLRPTKPSEPVEPEKKTVIPEPRPTLMPPSSGIAAQMNAQSIRQYMGINDQFLLLRDLFDNNSTEYERTIFELDSMNSLDEAMLYIHDRFPLKQNTDGAELLVDLVVRKLL